MVRAEASAVGRPRSFDVDAVLDELQALFWRKGYGQTSVADMVEATGVHKPSLYRVLGTKEEIFAKVLSRYQQAQIALIADHVESSQPGLTAMHQFIDGFGALALAGADRNGCLLVMASNELSGTTPSHEGFARRYRDDLRRQLSRLVRHSLPDRDLDAQDVELRATLLTTLFAGLQVAVRGGADDDEIRRVLDSMHALVDTW